MNFCRFMLALTVTVTGLGAAPPPPTHVTKPATSAFRIAGGRLWVRSAPGAAAAGGPCTLALSRGVRDWHGQGLTADEVARRVRRGADLSGIAAPFAAVDVDPAGRLSVAADHVGLRHVYAARGEGWAAVSSSARDLARLRGAGLDEDAIGEFRLIGHYLGTGTPYRGVEKLPPAGVWRLARGELALESYAEPEPPPVMDVDAAVELHAARLRETVDAFLDHHPGSVIELSGGLDSRMVLAAVRPERRRELSALTLSHPGSPDGAVAVGLAHRYGIEHHIVDLCGLAAVEPAEAYRAVLAMAERQDGAGSPVGAAALDWVERRAGTGAPRLGGHGGELARGAYYLQRQHRRVEPDVVDRFVRWWVIANNQVPDEVLAPAFAAESRARTRQRLVRMFTGYGTDWLTATDEFYLRERLHRWAGLTLTDAALTRVVVNPLLDPDVLAVVRGVPRERRSGSRYAARVLDRLDPDLARLPLSTGVPPIRLSHRLTLSRQLGENTLPGFTRKAVGKIGRKLRRAGSPPAGAAALARAVTAHVRAQPDLLAPAMATGLVREEWLDAYLGGRVEASPATVDLLVNLVVAGSG